DQPHGGSPAGGGRFWERRGRAFPAASGCAAPGRAGGLMLEGRTQSAGDLRSDRRGSPLTRLRTMVAFFRKVLLEEMSYRTAFVMQIGGILFTVTLWYLLASYLKPPKGALPEFPGVPYFAYLLVGIAFSHYLWSALSSFATKLRGEALPGTREGML